MRESGSRFPLIPMVFLGVEVRAQFRPVKVLHSNKPNHTFIVMALCTGAQSYFNRSLGLPQTVPAKFKVEMSKMSWYAEALGIPFTGTEGPNP